MKTGSCREWDGAKQKTQTNEIIYLYERPEESRYDEYRYDERRPDARRTRTGRKNRSGDIFWNIFFAAMCLSVLVYIVPALTARDIGCLRRRLRI